MTKISLSDPVGCSPWLLQMIFDVFEKLYWGREAFLVSRCKQLQYKKTIEGIARTTGDDTQTKTTAPSKRPQKPGLKGFTV